MIEDGTPFCPQCGAPQIRVQIPEGVAQPQPAPSSESQDSPAFVPGTPAEMQPPAHPVPLSAIPAADDRVPWKLALRPVLLGGAIILIGSMIPLGLAWNVLVIGGGAVAAVALFRRRTWNVLLRPSLGAKIGAAAAVFSCAVSAVLLVLACLIDGAEVRHQFIDRLQATQTQFGDPQTTEMFKTLVQKINTPEGFATLITLGVALSFLVFLVIGAAGGAIGASLMQRDRSGR